ncbi:penicillin-binding protein 1C [Roseovarius faecimaris]|uniref:peptidoglycan glycosyltransferase n=1 Tax=Roseovarius faecimaris TaxID=2494550 RepID=A0A6I6ISH3_9RHOB|nr:penicillin-binding protein 1C [Roseovarius faecimaris]QGY00020.1 penicillin-binding protein 1C [Roseovarius faecimaris]
MRVERLILGLALILVLAAFGRDRLDQWIDATDLPPLFAETSVELRDRNGALLRIYTVADGRWRLAVTPEQVDRQFIDMLIAYEDRRFYTHSGVDLRAMLRAVGQAVWHGEVVSGGSTLTMQVARLLEESGTGRWRGKLRQMRVAWALERKLGKEQILQLYLTHAPYGGNIEGVRAATLSWFGKEPARLTPAEAALLVALPQSPESRRPDRNRKQAEAARDRVLDRMISRDALDPDTARAALSEPVPASRRPFPALAPHMADLATRDAPEALLHRLTLDAPLQRSLEGLAKAALNGLPEDLSVAIVLADHQSGEILASVGSAGYDTGTTRQGFVDMTRARRSPGSTLKPLVYAMGFDRGLAHPQTLINDRPVSFGRYAPQNFDGAFRGELPVAEALRQSLNIPVVLLLDQIGPAHLMDVMRRAGTQPKLPGDQAGLAVALGGVGLSLTELVQLYAMLGQGGMERPLHWRLGDGAQGEDRILSPSAAWQVGDILAGLAPPANAPARRIAYKTGTSYGHRDAWAIGYDGRHVAGVWIGRPDGTPVPGAFGGDLAAPVLFEAFQRLKAEADPLPPPPPETLLLATADLPQPLRRFTGRNAVFQAAPDAPKLIFPPSGAVLDGANADVPVKVRDGTPPFSWMANGKLVRAGVYRREITLPGMGQGFSHLSVIDAEGRASRVTVRIE